MARLISLIPNCPNWKTREKLVSSHINQLGRAANLLPHNCNTRFREELVRMRNSWVNLEKVCSRLPPTAMALNHWNLLSFPCTCNSDNTLQLDIFRILHGNVWTSSFLPMLLPFDLAAFIPTIDQAKVA